MNFRHDIQALRGFAVLTILLYHADLGLFKAGYLGVDVFFVISGFLITSLIIKHITADDFSFAEFYYRRARRLLPAAYVVLLLTTLASLLFLSPGQYQEYKNQLVGSLSFTANFALYDQADYFSSGAREKPLLHMWSLSIEEQFYIVLPLLLYFTARRFWKPLLLALFFGSLALCMTRVGAHPDQTFYFLPTRAWELALGSLAALYPPHEKIMTFYKAMFWPAFAILIVLPVQPISAMHPGIDALSVCLATFVIIQRNILGIRTALPLPARGLSLLGNYSYSLYLVHWPLFAYATNAYITGHVPLHVRVALLAISVLAAFALYHTVEKPLHTRNFARRRTLAMPLIAASVLLAGLCMTFYKMNKAHPEFLGRRGQNVGIARICDHTGDYKKIDTCQTGEAPEIMIWGDSYAMHHILGIIANTDKPIIQATRRACSPFADIAYLDPPKYNHAWAESCIRFNRGVLDALADMPSVKTVLISSVFEKINTPQMTGWQRGADGSHRAVPLGPVTTAPAMIDTIKRINALGKKVIVLSPTPKNNFNVGMCLEKLRLQKIIIGDESACALHLSKAHEHQRYVLDFLNRLPKQNENFQLIRLHDHLCKDDICASSLDKVILYKDDGHITQEGSPVLVKHVDLIGKIERFTR